MAVIIAWFPQLLSLLGLALLGSIAIGGVLIVASQTRRAGNTIQDNLFAAWGGAPTTLLLRHRDPTMSAAEKQRYHALLQAMVPNIHIPTAQQELADPATADHNYEIAVSWLREHTRKNPVVNDENATYGFHRNSLALKPAGLRAAMVALVGSLVLLVLQWLSSGFSAGAVVALVISIVCFWVWWSYVTAQQVREAGFAYALALLRAIDGLASARH